MEFNHMEYRYPSRREAIFAKNGMVCTSQPLAAQAGLDILKQGGNAVDAAVATAAAMTVLERLPTESAEMPSRLYGWNGKKNCSD